MSNAELEVAVQAWLEYVKARKTLLTQGLVRSFKSPEADFAEWLIATIFRGELPDNKSNRGYDVIADDKRIQVKSIAKASDNTNGYKITGRDKSNTPETDATHYAFVFFYELIPTDIFLVPESFVRLFHKEQIKRADLERGDYKLDVDLSIFKI